MSQLLAHPDSDGVGLVDALLAELLEVEHLVVLVLRLDLGNLVDVLAGDVARDLRPVVHRAAVDPGGLVKEYLDLNEILFRSYQGLLIT